MSGFDRSVSAVLGSGLGNGLSARLPARPSDFRSALRRTVRELELRAAPLPACEGIPTGFQVLDELIGGWLPEQLVVVAAAPGVGATTLALTFARAAAVEAGHASLFVSLEWSERTLLEQLLCAEARVPVTRLSAASLTAADWECLSGRLRAIADAPLFIDDLPGRNGADLERLLRKATREHSIKLAVIDGAHRLRRDLYVARDGRGWLGHRLKGIAERLGLTIIATCPLSIGRAVDDRRPTLRHLRQVDHTLEDRSDIVLLLDRPAAYTWDSGRQGEADLIVAKNRRGPVRDIAIGAQLHYRRFVEVSNSTAR